MLSIIIPTYNEKENISRIIERIFIVFEKNNIVGEVIVVDDDSKDGTVELAKKMMIKYNVKLLVRKNKKGLSSAVIDGIALADYDIVGVIDADLSHPPELIPKLLLPILKGEVKFTLASRYIEGGRVEGWKFVRKAISRGATILAMPLTKIRDPMSGYMMFKKEIIEGVNLNPVGYKIALEIIVKGKIKNALEIPYTFKDRELGASKLNWKEQVKYIQHLSRLYCYKYPIIIQFLLFAIIGGFGMLVDIFTYSFLYYILDFKNIDIGWYFHSYILAQMISFCFAVTSNFFLNKKFTFKVRGNAIEQYTKFFIVAVLALIIRSLLMDFFVEKLKLFHLSSLIFVIIIVMGINFIGSKIWAFKNDSK